MSRAIVVCALGPLVVDLSDGSIEDEEAVTPDRPDVAVGLPLVVAADQVGARIICVLDRRPPIVVSDDAGATWLEAGGGLPPGVDVALSRESPDDALFAGHERLFVSHDGGRFWSALTLELPGITAVAFDE